MGNDKVKKYIIIAGVSHAGKSTVLQMIVEKTGYQHISSKVAPFIRDMMDSGEYEECDYGVVINVYQLLPKDYAAYIDNDRVCQIMRNWKM